MKKFTITTEIASDLTLEEVADLFTELINDKIGVLISGKGEYKQDTSFKDTPVDREEAIQHEMADLINTDDQLYELIDEEF